MVAYMNEKHADDDRVKRLVKGFNPKKISETLPTSELTAYSENKGEKIAFCLNTTKDGDKLIDINTLTFVALHELSHIMTTSIGHKQEFWANFKFLLENAKEEDVFALSKREKTRILYYIQRTINFVEKYLNKKTELLEKTVLNEDVIREIISFL